VTAWPYDPSGRAEGYQDKGSVGQSPDGRQERALALRNLRVKNGGEAAHSYFPLFSLLLKIRARKIGSELVEQLRNGE